MGHQVQTSDHVCLLYYTLPHLKQALATTGGALRQIWITHPHDAQLRMGTSATKKIANNKETILEQVQEPDISADKPVTNTKSDGAKKTSASRGKASTSPTKRAVATSSTRRRAANSKAKDGESK